MKKFRDLSVGTKLTIKIISVLVAVLAALFAVIIVITANNNETQANNGAQSLAESDAAHIDAELEVSIDAARAVAQGMQGFAELNTADRRDIYNNLMKSFLAENPQYLGIWTCWEPNALDNMDSQYKNTDGTDESGRFISYWYYDGGQIALTSLTGYEEPGSGDYYLLAKNSGQETILEPYEYEVGGKTVLLTSVAVPVKDESGNIVAVTGIDMTLESLQNMQFDKGGFETAFVNILSNSGLFVYHQDAASVGKNIRDIRADSLSLDDQTTAIKSGEAYTCEDVSASTGKVVRRYFAPITIGQTTTPWSIEVVIETNEILETTNQMTLLLVGILVGITVLAILVLTFLIRSSISKPIKKTAAFAKSLASGDLDAAIVIKSKDEIGQLAGVLDQEVRQAFKNVEEARLVADRQSKYQSAEVDKLLVNLQRLARGELNCDIIVAEADDVTEEQHALFSEIAENLHSAVGEIRNYIGEISMVLGEMSKGNLTVGIAAVYKGEFTTLKDSINGIAASLNGVLSEINLSADQVAAGTRQVSDGSQAISQGATEQASAIEELTASVSQIAEQTRQNAISANQASELTTTAADEAERGNGRMKAMQAAMGEINEASRSIEKIIKVIDDIAFQTNILALNAAVEAARAGVHGKGFAVVAEEVRNLAARSASAAKETTELIEGSIQKTDAGTKIADETAEALTSIVRSVYKAVELVGEIARASGEQAGAIAQVDRGIEQMSQVVQTNSATSEETAAAAEELSSQAEMLKNMVGQFSLRDAGESQPRLIQGTDKERSLSAIKTTGIDISDNNFGKY